MSYEGRTQMICDNGHYSVYQTPYSFSAEAEKCHCGAVAAWENYIDDTNCEAEGAVDVDVYMIAEEKLCTCSCGHTHVSEPAKYRIPSDVGRRAR